ncbi:TPA: DUF4041 domain-containing protein [Salmonella enterica subsp. enterica serovar Infantis]|nr:DUF4041 domain-containing protein [Salmonella enterica]MDO3933718.1 DUF4041 domain-containing protein [Salmonella enterica]
MPINSGEGKIGMVWGLLGCILLLLIILLICFIKLKSQKKKHDADMERFSKIVDLEAEELRLRNQLNEEEKSFRKKLSDDEESARQSIQQEIEGKRKAFDKEFNEKSSALDKKEKAVQEALSIHEAELAALKSEYREKRALLVKLTEKLSSVSDAAAMIDYGVYEPTFDYHDSVAYQEAITKNKERQKILLRQEAACDFSTDWQVNGSKAEGKKMVKRYVKLLVRAFNSECDAAIAKIKAGNVEQLQKRIESAFDAINKFGESMNIRITYDYLNLRLEELLLCHEKELKLQDEREILREERELQREEEKAQREYEKAIREEQKAERDFEKAMDRARKELEKATSAEKEQIEQRIAELERQLEEARKLSERAKSQAQLTRSGHVYVISNVGAFGEGVYKIGLTRRLVPEERVNELGSASVPFKFDIHALIYSDDAPALEASLHNEFSAHRVNLINNRKEFFRVPLKSIEQKVKSLGFDAAFVEFAKAPEYRQTLALLDEKSKRESLHEAIEHKVEEEFPEMA